MGAFAILFSLFFVWDLNENQYLTGGVVVQVLHLVLLFLSQETDDETLASDKLAKLAEYFLAPSAYKRIFDDPYLVKYGMIVTAITAIASFFQQYDAVTLIFSIINLAYLTYATKLFLLNRYV
jgi:hypothetical protein